MAKKLDYEYCKAAPVLEWLGNKWAMAVLLKIAETILYVSMNCIVLFLLFQRKSCHLCSGN